MNEEARYTYLVGFDFNFLTRGDIPIRISTGNLEIPSKRNDTRATSQSNYKWNMMLANSMEHHQTNQTRIGHNPSANDNPNTLYLIAKRIDRIYSSNLPWRAINF